MEIALPIIVLAVFIFLGIPIALALAGAGVLGIWLITGDWNTVMGVIGTTTFSTVAHFIITTIPMFILMAHFSASGGLANDVFNAASDWLSWIRGGLAIGTVFACGIFGAMSGSSLAAGSVMTKVAMPNMRRVGYSDILASGVIAVGATLDILIPPSAAMVFYGILTGQSIGKLLMAGVVPSIVLGIFLSFIILIWVTIKPSHAPKTQQVSWMACWRSLYRTWPSFLLILMVMVTLYTGVITATEVGAVGALMAAVLGVVKGSLTWSGILESVKETIKTSSMIFMILIGGMIFGYYMALSGVPQKLMTIVAEMNINRWVVIVSIIIAYFLISMSMDEIPLLLITVQVAYPLVTSLGFDPIWFGVLMMLMVMMGLVFPPVGLMAFVVSATGNIDLVTVYKGTSILVIAIFLTTVIIMIFPQIVLWLPSMMY